MVPMGRPQASLSDVLSFIDGPIPDTPFLVGRRGYYADSMGVAGKNAIGIYDDAEFLIDAGTVFAWNANVDPSRTRPGMATLVPGRYWYKLGIHNISKDPALHPHYEALVQASPVTVARDGGPTETGWFGINHHRGSVNSTSSEGCQTIVPNEYDEYIATVKAAMKAAAVSQILYILTARDGT